MRCSALASGSNTGSEIRNMSEQVEDIVRRAASAFNAGRREDARQFCEEGLRRWPNEPTLNHLLAAVVFAIGETGLARSHVEKSLKARPDNAATRLLAARIARAEQDFNSALSHLERATSPSNPNIPVEKARTLDLAGRREDARAIWRQILITSPGNHEALARLGRLSWEDGRPVEAAALLERAVAGDCPASTWFDLGLARQDLRDYAAAAHAYRQALAKKQDYAEAAVNLGITLQETGNLEAAFAAFGTAYRMQASAFGVIAMALTSSSNGKLWLDEDALRDALQDAEPINPA
jgi:tetratricopeptide (TPR) repeat protein